MKLTPNHVRAILADYTSRSEGWAADLGNLGRDLLEAHEVIARLTAELERETNLSEQANAMRHGETERADKAEAKLTAEPVDPLAIEGTGKRWHGEDHRVVSVRWEPYKPDGARQMKARGRWQELVGSGDYWRWQNCGIPTALQSTPPKEPTDE